MTLYVNEQTYTLRSNEPVEWHRFTVEVPAASLGSIAYWQPPNSTTMVTSTKGGDLVPATFCGSDYMNILAEDATIGIRQERPGYAPVTASIHFQRAPSTTVDISPAYNDEEPDLTTYRDVAARFAKQSDGVRDIILDHFLTKDGLTTAYTPQAFLTLVEETLQRDQNHVEVTATRHVAQDPRLAYSTYEFLFTNTCTRASTRFTIRSGDADPRTGAWYDAQIRHALGLPSNYFSFKGSQFGTSCGQPGQ
jgi:hypothetical protein